MNFAGAVDHVVVKATVILAAGWLMSWALRRQAATSRYVLWGCALSAVLMLPVLSVSFERTHVVLAAPLPVVEAIGVPDAPAPAERPAEFPWSAGMRAVWMIGAVAAMIRLGVGHVRAMVLGRRAMPLEDATADRLCEHFNAGRRVRLLQSAEIDVPVSFGVLRPTVVLPQEHLAWDAARRSAVLTHELIHIRRRDPVWSLVANLAGAFYWFHPLAWAAVRAFRREQEVSCDDAVLAAGVGSADYAEHLVTTARGAHPWLAAESMAHPWKLEERVRAILDPSRNRRSLSRGIVGVALAGAVACLVPLAALRAQNANGAFVTGSVLDPSGAAVPKAIVELRLLDGKGEDVTRGDAAGEYHFRGIKAGRYEVQVKAPGFALLKKDVEFQAGQNPRLDLTVNVGRVAETLDVVAKAPSLPAGAGARTPQRIRVGGNVQATKLLKRVAPSYPAAAQAAGVSGTVLLRAVISVNGDLLGLSVINTADPDLAAAAVDAVKQWKYQPTLLNGVPVEVVTTVTVNFRLE